MSPHDQWASGDDANLRATKEMCHYCFDLLVHELAISDKQKVVGYRFDSNMLEASLPPTASCPLFVTWDKRRGSIKTSYNANDFELRGCIGTLSPRPLVPGIREYALTSAFRDRRFDPISKEEIPHLRVAVSLLVKYEECSNCFDWIVGTHGILIRFSHATIQYSATYLPEVALEQGWDQEQAVSSLIRKAGYRGDINTDFMNKIHCTRYQSSKDRMTYEEFVSKIGIDPLESSDKRPSTVGWRTCMNL